VKTYRITILEEDDAVDFVSFVDRPAIERNLVAFNAYQEHAKVALNEEQRIVTTPVLIPDMPIYRNQGGEEFYLVALPEDVKAIYHKFMKDGNANKLNLMHTKGTELETKDAFLLEVFLSDETRGIEAPRDFKDLPNQTWFASYKINSDELWNDIKAGKINGVSIEGYLGMVDLSKDSEYNAMQELYEKILGLNKTVTKMNITEKISNAVNDLKVSLGINEQATEATEAPAEVVELMEAVLVDGTMVKYDSLEVGSALTVVSEAGETPAPDGTHEFEDGTLVTTVEGAITEVVQVETGEEEVAPDMEFESKMKEMLEAFDAKFEAQKTAFESSLKENNEKVLQALEAISKEVELAANTPVEASTPEQKPSVLAMLRSIK
jgi:hypothetical protein